MLRPICVFCVCVPAPSLPNKKVDWLAFVSAMQAAENNEDGDGTNNNGNLSTSSRKQSGTVRAGRQRVGLRSTLTHRSSRPQQQHWATSDPGRGRRGLFDGEGKKIETNATDAT